MENINFDAMAGTTGKLSDRLTVKRLAGYNDDVKRNAIDAQYLLRQAMTHLALCAGLSGSPREAGGRAFYESEMVRNLSTPDWDSLSGEDKEDWMCATEATIELVVEDVA